MTYKVNFLSNEVRLNWFTVMLQHVVWSVGWLVSEVFEPQSAFIDQ